MNKVKLGLRLFLGLVYFVFGLNGFLNFMPPPPNMPEGAAAFSSALAASGYFFPFLKATEVLGGVALLSGLFVPLALVVLAPVTLNIVLFHAFLAPQGMYIQVAMLISHLVLGWFYKETFEKLLKANS